MQTLLYQSTTFRLALKVYLSSDHLSPAIGKTVAVTISKNGAAFGNPSAGATNAVEIGSGWYYVDVSTTDTGTLGPLVVLGTATACDPADQGFQVVKATNLGMTAVPDAVAAASGGLPTFGTGTGQINPTAGNVDVNTKTGFSLAAAGLDAVVIETGLNARQSLSLLAAALAGLGGTTSGLYKGAGVATTRITFTAAGGERSAITLNAPA